MGIFGLKLKKVNDAWSGLDFWDKNENKQQRQAAAVMPKPTPIYTGSADNRPGFQWNNNSLTRGFSRAYDQANILDNGISWQQRTANTNNSGAQQITPILKSLIKAPVQMINTAGTQLPQLYYTLAGTVADITNNDVALNNALKKQEQANSQFNQNSGGLFNMGTFYGAEDARKGDLETGLKKIGGGTLQTMATVAPFAKGGSVATLLGGKSVPVKSAILGGEGGAYGSVFSAGSQLQNEGRIDPTTLLKDTVTGALVGGAIPVAGAAGRVIVNKTLPGASRAAGDLIDTTKDVVVNSRAKVKTPGSMTDSVRSDKLFQDLDKRVYKAIDNASKSTGKLKENYRQEALELIKQRNERASALSQGGFANPKAVVDTVKNVSGKVKVTAPKDTKVAVTPTKTPKVIVKPAKNNVLQEVNRGMSDQDQVILDELRSIEKQTGQKGLVDKFMYLSNQQRGSNRVANVNMERSKNVQEAIGNMKKGEADAFSTYSNARTELAWAKSQKTPTGRQRKVRTSASIPELEAIVKGGEKQYGKRFKSLNKHYQELTDIAQKAGIIDKKTAATYKKNKDYVRLQRDLDEKIPPATGGRGQGYQLGSTTLKQKRKGSKRDTLDASEVMAERTQQVYREAAKNRTGNMLVDTLEKSGLATKVPASKAANLNTVGVFKNGTKVYYEVSPAIKEAMDNINPYSMNVVMQILAAPGRIFRAGVTGLNPVFIARNLVKDQFGSAINSKSMASTHNPKTFFAGIARANMDAFGKQRNGELWDEFLKHYGDQTSYDLTRNVKDTRKVVAGIQGGRRVKVVNNLKSPIRTLENFASITEKSTRYQNFVGAHKYATETLKLNKSDAMEYAALQAWQNSVDFARAGTWGRVINTVLPYWNPSIQGVRQLVRTFKDRPVSSTMKGTALIGVPLVAATAWNMSHEDTRKVYDNIPEFEKENNLILIPPGTKQNADGTYDVFKIPLPPGFKDAFMPLRRVMESFYNKEPVKMGEIAQDIIQTVSGPLQVSSKGAFAGSFIPQIAKPAVQAAANKDFFTGRDIVPEYMNEATDAEGNPIAESKKAYDSTSGTARIIAERLGISPIKVEKFIKDSGGTVGLNVINAVDTGMAKAGVIPEEQIGGQSVATGFKRSFASTQGIENYNKSEGAKYFDDVKEVTKNLNQNEKDAYNALHPAKRNFLGDQIYEKEAAYDPAARLDIYNRFPKVYDADKALDAKNRAAGKPGNPLFDLESWQLKKVLEKENLPPGAKDPELSNLYNQEWYQDYRTGKTEFFNKLKTQAESEGRTFGSNDNPYPDTPPQVQRAMDYYSSLPKGTGERSAWIKGNPGIWKAMQQQFALVDNWQNIARGKRGLDMTEGAIGDAAGYGSGSSYSSGGGKSSTIDPSKYIKKYSVSGNVRKGTPSSYGKVTVKARTSGGGGGKIKVTSKKQRLA